MLFAPAQRPEVIQNPGPLPVVGTGFCQREFASLVMMLKICHLTFVNARSVSTIECTGVSGIKCVCLSSCKQVQNDWHVSMISLVERN